MGLLVDCTDEVGVLSGEAGLEGVLEGEEIGQRKVTTGIVGISISERVNGWKFSSGSERTGRQSSEGGNFECTAAQKKNEDEFKEGRMGLRLG